MCFTTNLIASLSQAPIIDVISNSFIVLEVICCDLFMLLIRHVMAGLSPSSARNIICYSIIIAVVTTVLRIIVFPFVNSSHHKRTEPGSKSVKSKDYERIYCI
jgi:hypothetical protein